MLLIVAAESTRPSAVLGWRCSADHKMHVGQNACKLWVEALKLAAMMI
jgi:hypothetical protein